MHLCSASAFWGSFALLLCSLFFHVVQGSQQHDEGQGARGGSEGGGVGEGGEGDDKGTSAQQVSCCSLQCFVLVKVCLLWNVLTHQCHSMIPAIKQTLRAAGHTDRQTESMKYKQTDIPWSVDKHVTQTWFWKDFPSLPVLVESQASLQSRLVTHTLQCMVCMLSS